MYDLKLDDNGDILLNDNNDFEITTSPVQQVRIKLKWIKDEWRLGPDFGIDYFGSIFVKNPDLDFIGLMLIGEVLSVSEVTKAEISERQYDASTRFAKFVIKFTINEEDYYEELGIKIGEDTASSFIGEKDEDEYQAYWWENDEVHKGDGKWQVTE